MEKLEAAIKKLEEIAEPLRPDRPKPILYFPAKKVDVHCPNCRARVKLNFRTGVEELKGQQCHKCRKWFTFKRKPIMLA